MQTRWRIYSDYPAIWKSMIEDIESAKESICFEQYIFADFEEGDIGRKFLDALKKKAKEGVKVKMLLDAQGSYTFQLNNLIADDEGAIDIVYHTASTYRWRTIFKSMFREHRKHIVIDGRIAHIGGAIQQDKARLWGEINVRFEGQIVSNLERAFLLAYNGLKKSNVFAISTPMQSEEGFKIVPNGPLPSQHHILDSIGSAISNSKKYIKITSPYFVPTRKLFKKIKSARSRGVDIEIILPDDIDNIVAKYVSFSYYSKMLKMGVKIYQFDKYMHGKSVIVDGLWATVGSSNFDRLSFLHNYELNVESENKEFVFDLEKVYESFKPKCKELNLPEWRKRPLTTKILERLSYFFRPIA